MINKSVIFLSITLLLFIITEVNADVVTCGTNIAINIQNKDPILKQAHKSKTKDKPKHKSSSKILGNFKLLIPNKLR